MTGEGGGTTKGWSLHHRVSLLRAVVFFVCAAGCVSFSRSRRVFRRGVLRPLYARGSRASATAPPPPALPFVDIIIAVPVPWGRVEMVPSVASAAASARDTGRSRRANVFLAFQRMAAATNATAHLLFILGGPPPSPLSEEDAVIFAHPSVTAFSAPCLDIDDKPWPGATWGELLPLVNSSMTCKVQRGAAYAVNHFRFRFFANVGSDAILRWPYFFEHWAERLPHEGLVFGLLDFPTIHIPPHLEPVFGDGGGRFSHYPSGMGYILSPDVAAYLGAPLTHPRFTTAGPEDAAIGHILSPLDLNRVHSDHFTNVDEGCSTATVLLHYVSDAHIDAIDANGVIHC